MKQEIKFCKDCTNQLQAKPLNRCGASRDVDPTDGDERRVCLIERLDGIGRCGSLGNNFSPKTAKPPVKRVNPAKVIEK